MTGRLVDAPYGLDPSAHDRGVWGASLLYNAELVMGVLDAARPKTITEVGALHGDLTRLLLLWAQQTSVRIVAIDPSPQPELEALVRDRPGLRLIREPSIRVLAELPVADAVILDGDHNYWTVTQELRIIGERAHDQQRDLPLLLLHDVGWPHGRRDDYYVPERIPPEHRQPIAPEGALYPGDPGIRPGALPYHHPAAWEGGPGNGVLTAVEDFVATRDQLQLAIVPSFFGMAVIWDRTIAAAPALSRLLADWDRNPHLERLERNRVLHLANTQLQLTAVREAERRLAEQGQQLARQRELLGRLLNSRSFAAIERVLRWRNPELGFSREEIRGVLESGHPTG